MGGPVPGDALLRAYARLEGLYAHVPPQHIPTEFAEEYNDEVGRVGDETGLDVADFLSPPSDRYDRHGRSYVDRERFLARFTGLINYLRANMPDEAPRKMGF